MNYNSFSCMWNSSCTRMGINLCHDRYARRTQIRSRFAKLASLEGQLKFSLIYSYKSSPHTWSKKIHHLIYLQSICPKARHPKLPNTCESIVNI